jgi:bis(5'-nucleosyl)-tetraphosphatase (symmetrical)
MTTYAVGDIQGCFYSFQNLLDQLSFNPARDNLWLVGDLINRGSGSLEVLNWCFNSQSSIKVVLGNHDLHFLAVAFNQKKLSKSDTLGELLNSKKLKRYIDWVISQPLVHSNQDHLMVHAGLLPQWTVELSQKLSNEVVSYLQQHPEDFFKKMYGNQPNLWSDQLKDFDKKRLVINAMTRLRCLNQDLSIDYDYKGTLESLPDKLTPWFDVKPEKDRHHQILTGHWSALGAIRHNLGYSLDSGCVWGHELTALNLDNDQLISVPADPRDLR